MTALEKEMYLIERRAIMDNLKKMIADSKQDNEPHPEQKKMVKAIILGAKRVRRINEKLGHYTFTEDLIIAWSNDMWQLLKNVKMARK